MVKTCRNLKRRKIVNANSTVGIYWSRANAACIIVTAVSRCDCVCADYLQQSVTGHAHNNPSCPDQSTNSLVAGAGEEYRQIRRQSSQGTAGRHFAFVKNGNLIPPAKMAGVHLLRFPQGPPALTIHAELPAG